jgi:hypothetical protein
MRVLGGLMLLLCADEILFEFWFGLQPFDGRSSDEFSANDVTGIMDGTDNSAISVLPGATHQLWRSVGSNVCQDQRS